MVTGAGSGIGRALSVALAARRVNLALVDRDAHAIEQTAALVAAAKVNTSQHALDVRDTDAIEALPGAVLDTHGACHIVVNNAGVTSAGAFAEESVQDLAWIIDINVWGVVHGCRVFLPVLREADEAHIVNMSSMVGLLGLPHNAAYSLTKGAVRAFGEALRAELASAQIGVTTVFPGAIRTNITNSARGSRAATLARMGNSRWAPLAMRPPSRVADRVVRAIERNRGRVVVGPDAHLVSAWSRLAPGRSGALGRLTARM